MSLRENRTRFHAAASAFAELKTGSRMNKCTVQIPNDSTPILSGSSREFRQNYRICFVGNLKGGLTKSCFLKNGSSFFPANCMPIKSGAGGLTRKPPDLEMIKNSA
jgi:hypothetical protein